MDIEIPRFVQRVLEEWDFISYFAYEKYETRGRGVVILLEEKHTMAGYCGADYFLERGKTKEAKLIADYDPKEEFLVHFEAPDGCKTLRVGTPSGGRNPKEIWFFKTLQKINQSPDDIPADLPLWFLDALEKIQSDQTLQAGGVAG
jgi:hypothetical protein